MWELAVLGVEVFSNRLCVAAWIVQSVEAETYQFEYQVGRRSSSSTHVWHNADNLVVTLRDGSAPNPESFSNLLGKLVKRSGLRTIRLHDLRDSYATAALAAGVPVKVVSQRLGHADVRVTLMVYAHVMPGDDEAAATTADSLLG